MTYSSGDWVRTQCEPQLPSARPNHHVNLVMVAANGLGDKYDRIM